MNCKFCGRKVKDFEYHLKTSGRCNEKYVNEQFAMSKASELLNRRKWLDEARALAVARGKNLIDIKA